MNVQDNVWYKYKFKIVTKFIFFYLIYRSFESNAHVKRMIFTYVSTLLMYAGKLNTYEIKLFCAIFAHKHVPIQCNAHVKNWNV